MDYTDGQVCEFFKLVFTEYRKHINPHTVWMTHGYHVPASRRISEYHIFHHMNNIFLKYQKKMSYMVQQRDISNSIKCSYQM